MFFKRYDSKRVRGWGSANDMTIKELREVREVEGIKDEEKDKAEALRTRRRRGGADCCVERRVWRLTFKAQINTGVIGVSMCTYMSFERVVEKSSNAIRGFSRHIPPETVGRPPSCPNILHWSCSMIGLSAI